MKNPSTVHYSQLQYEKISHRRGGRPRVWYLEQELSYKTFARDLLGDIWKLIKWFSRLPGKKEVVIGIMMLIGFLPHVEQVYAAPLPQHEAPYYLQPIKRLQPVKAVAFASPVTLQPVATPPSTPAPVAARATAPMPTASYPMGANSYRDYIFRVESGFNAAAINGGGCIGYGQDCNGWLITGRLSSVACPNWRTDIACQLQYWDWYANTIYGGWANAYAFRTTHNYW